jgi:hypothetical protein
MLHSLTSDDFQPCLNQSFHLRFDPPVDLALELVQVTDLGEVPAPGQARRRAFSLLFYGPPSRGCLPQRIYRLEHTGLGALDIFLVPIGPEMGRMRYEAIFS